MTPRRPRSSRLREDRGSATAETAVVLPVVVMLVLVLGLAGSGLALQVRLETGARAAARELARGEDEGSAIAAAREVAGPSADVSISREGDLVRVRVTRELRASSGILAGARWPLAAEAVARVEPHLVGAFP
ncbi:MAG: TadE family type IV pilus minor pilin [Brachybacterium sp.]|nr:TadE family type IV pilus minor pilin [Brachybacterium sp.]